VAALAWNEFKMLPTTAGSTLATPLVLVLVLVLMVVLVLALDCSANSRLSARTNESCKPYPGEV